MKGLFHLVCTAAIGVLCGVGVTRACGGDGEVGQRVVVAARPPNIVLLVCDDLGWGEIGVEPTPAVPAPHLHALADSGVTFTRAYATAPMCGPSRAGILTGQYQQRHGFEFNPEDAAGARVDPNCLGLDPATRTLAEALRMRGYRTAAIGKWHLGDAPAFAPLRNGFDEFFGFRGGWSEHRAPEQAERPLWRDGERATSDGYLTDVFTDEACAFIDRSAGGAFFLYVGFSAIHRPLQPRRGDARFAELPLRERRFARMIAAMDDGVGRIMESLERNGLVENTIVCFVSDNGGETNGGVHVNGPLRMGKRYLFEGGVRVPMMVRWPGVAEPGTIVGEVHSTLDLAPTLIRAAGGSTLWMGLDEVDLERVLRGQDGQVEASDRGGGGALAEADDGAGVRGSRALFWRMGASSAVRVGRWKLVCSGESRWLFDLDADDGETTDMHLARPDVVEELERRLAVWERRLETPRWPAPRRVATPIDGQEYQVGG